MKKLNDANIGILVLLSTCLCLFSCNNDNDNLPKDYAGFEHSKETNQSVNWKLKLWRWRKRKKTGR